MHNWNKPDSPLFLILSLMGCMIALSFSPPAFGRLNAPMAVHILAINDFHGQLTAGQTVSNRPVGSAPILATYLKQAASQYALPPFIVHAGDLVGASPPESALLQDEPTIMFFNQLGNPQCSASNRMNPYCNLVGTLGNHEFDEGREELLRLLHGGNHTTGPFLDSPWKGAYYPTVCANVVYKATGKTLVPASVVKIVNKTPVAFIGAVLQNTASLVTASGIIGLQFIDEAQAINRQVQNLKRRGIETIVVLLHQGGTQNSYTGSTDSNAEEPAGEIEAIIQQLDSEVDVVITGHTHGFTNSSMKNGEGTEILVTQAWAKGTAYADISLTIDPQTKDVTEKSAKIITTWADEALEISPDLAATALVAKAVKATEAKTAEIITQTQAAIVKTQNNAGESALGNLIADAQREQMGTDFACINPGGIRADLPAGEVTWGDLYTIQPFTNYLMQVTLTGEQLYTLLNQQFTPHQPYNRILQISGFTYSWNPERTDNDLVVEILKDGVPLDRTATYTLTVNSFLAEGGDNFTVLTEAVSQKVGPVDLDALIAYLQGQAQPISAEIDGRIQLSSE